MMNSDLERIGPAGRALNIAGALLVVTEIFHHDDPYMDEDPVFGAREQLVVRLAAETDVSAIPHPLAAAKRLKQPF